ncbi:MAG: phosphate ABC transporter permease PstA [Gemmataceae bacterium]
MDDHLTHLIARRRRQDALFGALGMACTLLGIATLVVLLIDLVVAGLPRLNWSFLTSPTSVLSPSRAGIQVALIDSLLIMVVTAVTAVPLGVAAGVYLEEYARKNWLTSLIELNISNLAAVPSILYGLLSLGLLLYYLNLFRVGLGEAHDRWPLGPRGSLAAAGVTLALLILPIVIVATREALRAVPQAIREAAYALGATRWQVVRYHLLPYSAGGIATGVIIGLSRAIGETAPLVTIGAAAFWTALPPSPVEASPPFVSFDWLVEPFTAMPIQMFNWTQEARPEYRANAAAAGVVLILMTLGLNAVAIVLRYRLRRRIKW